MKKISLSLVLFIIVVATFIIPYWTGVEAEKQLDPFWQPVPFLTPLDHDYKRGWWSSEARTHFKIQGIPETLPSPPHFYLVHQVDHGFLPIKPTVIETSLYYSEVTGEAKGKEIQLLQAQTRWQSQENLRSHIIMPPLVWTAAENQMRLDWQGLQGDVYLTQHGELFQADLEMPQLLLKMEAYQIAAHNLLVNVQWQLLNFLKNQGYLTIASLQVKTSQPSLIALEGVTVEGNNQVANESLTGFLKTRVQQIQIGEDNYGSAYGEIELQRLHLESLVSIFQLWLENRSSGGLAPRQLNLVTLARLIPIGLTLLNQSPKLAITQLRLDTPAGELQGTLEITTAPLEAQILFNPAAFFNAFQVQAKLRLSDTLLSQLTQTWLNLSAVQEPVGQRIQTWLDQNLLVESEPHVYSIQLQLENGDLQINGKNLPQ